MDSRPGVILHEMAHDVSPLIGDHSYGVAVREALAAKNPDRQSEARTITSILRSRFKRASSARSSF